jgi:hypothetical protein
MIWDSYNFKLLHVLAGFSGPVISVSINHLCGNVAVLTTGRMALYNINGVIISSVALSDPLSSHISGVHGTPQAGLGPNHGHMNPASAFKLRPRVVLAPPTADWQDGVVAVTGHEAGHLFLWKLQTSPPTKPANSLGEDAAADKPDHQGEGSDNGSKMQRLLVPYSTLRSHKADICVLRFCPWNIPKGRPLVPRHYEGENGYELLVGDVEGNVSRWEAARLDQLTAAEINGLATRYLSKRIKLTARSSDVNSPGSSDSEAVSTIMSEFGGRGETVAAFAYSNG